MVSAVLAGLLSTLFTYALTALGAGLVYVYDTRASKERTDRAMAVAIGLMLAAVMELLNEALSLSEGMHFWRWVPICTGIVTAVIGLYFVERALARMDQETGPDLVEPRGLRAAEESLVDTEALVIELPEVVSSSRGVSPDSTDGLIGAPKLRDFEDGVAEDHTRAPTVTATAAEATPEELRKAKLLVFALAIQHIPEALACGVAFAGAVTDGSSSSWGAAYALTIAIGLQDIPEGATAACVLRGIGMSKNKSFFYGQLTGIGQPIGGILGALAVVVVESILPYALAFAGAAMLFVLLKDMIPDVMVDPQRRMESVNLSMISFAFMNALSSIIDGMT